MKIVETFDALQEALLRLKRPLGFVPTMGYLHEGHLSLVKRAKQDCESVVVSIFANPAQFAPDEDLDNYPRDIDRDLELLTGVGTNLVWIPSVINMYPEDFQTWINVEQVTKPLEGQVRNTHFQGVTTVVSKLFNAVRPDKSYFGQKDAQQAVVIKQMVRDLNYPIEIVICPIVREVDGLAMSSRNSYLNEEERQAALCLSQGLSKAEEAFHKGEKNAEKIREIVASVIDEEQLAELQYVSCAHPETLEELEGEIESCLLSMAVFIGRTRLIDNILLLQPKT
ncbi:MAG: pantoate--beta-alanine ligase [Anaerolineales bacterium]|nr:pantoate--beta-alanine ligase [Anaerolineales bacterium]